MTLRIKLSSTQPQPPLRLRVFTMCHAGHIVNTPPGCMPDHWALHHAQWEQSAEGRAAPLLVWESVEGSPGGWGDRLRGAMLAMRVASKHKRSLRLLFEGKHFLAPYLQPATFDWHLKLPDMNDAEANAAGQGRTCPCFCTVSRRSRSARRCRSTISSWSCRPRSALPTSN